MFESLSDAYFLLGKQGEVIDFNRAAYNFVWEKFSMSPISNQFNRTSFKN